MVCSSTANGIVLQEQLHMALRDMKKNLRCPPVPKVRLCYGCLEIKERNIWCEDVSSVVLICGLMRLASELFVASGKVSEKDDSPSTIVNMPMKL